MIQVSIGNDAINMVILNTSLENVINVDYARLGAQVITGVGFLGAGTILHTKGSIKGLTTAASLWAVAILGLAIGMGYYNLSIFGGIAIIVSLVSLKRLENKFMKSSELISLEIRCRKREASLNFINDILKKYLIEIREIECLEYEYEGKINIYVIKLCKSIDMNDILNELIINEDIKSVKIINSI